MMHIKEDEYRCYGFEVLPQEDTISKLGSIEGQALMDKTKSEISFLGVHNTGNSVLFIFADNPTCMKYMSYFGNIEDVRYVGECAIKKEAV